MQEDTKDIFTSLAFMRKENKSFSIGYLHMQRRY
jgi:hypothetical protein